MKNFFIVQAIDCIERTKKSPLQETDRQRLASDLAGYIVQAADLVQTSKEKSFQRELARMMDDPNGKAFTTSMTDQCFRTSDVNRIADQIIYLLNKFGVPRFLFPFKKFQLTIFKYFGRSLASIIVPLAKAALRKQTSTVILPAEPARLNKYLQKRFEEKVRINFNRLGEKVLGEEEAQSYLKKYLEDLANPKIEYISIKISTIYSQINLLSWDETLSILCERLKILYRASKKHLYTNKSGNTSSKFINLDMEAYTDLYLTVEVFCRVLSDLEFLDYSAGIVLQSYLPDSYAIQQELTSWAANRLEKGGSPIKIRIVKGANLAMEQIEASLKGWEQAPYTNKSDVDANFKRMLIYGVQPQSIKAVHLGVASHNIFDIAYTLILRAENGLESYICFEMLEGMADHIRRVVQTLSGEMLLYCPAATQEDFQSAVAYLVRRLDENTSPNNFLHDAFGLMPGSARWNRQLEFFLNAFKKIETISSQPRRHQNRLLTPLKADSNPLFVNDPSTDWTISSNRLWTRNIINDWSKKSFETIPVVMGNRSVINSLNLGSGEDPSYPGKVLYHYSFATDDELEIALQTALKGSVHWISTSLEMRFKLLDEVAHLLNVYRGDLIGVMIADTGKTFSEGDTEVSEAIDFASYYRHSAESLLLNSDIEWEPKGVVLVAPPWNFPCAIPAGGILAALAAGNSVIFKPAPEAILVGWKLVNILWEAGIDRDVLQFFCCDDDAIGSKLVQDSRINTVILTGATSTAKKLLKIRPGLDLIAETGGKNSMIITRMADRDLAIKDLIYSAFGHAGQKCSACSLALLEREVYEDPKFRRQLKDAAASLKVGSPWDLGVIVNPLIREAHSDLLRALTTLEEGEEWLLEPKQDLLNKNLWSPGIKLGVKLGSFMQQTELFGPILGLMCVSDIENAVLIANSTSYGLTAGLHSLDEREQYFWSSHIIAGNCYINRGITGAIVQRQPFGGCKESCLGGGAKAGGPNYLLQLMEVRKETAPKQQEALCDAMEIFDQTVQKNDWSQGMVDLWKASLGSYSFHYHHFYSIIVDPSKILGQENLFFYVPQFSQVLRVHESDSMFDIYRLIAAFLTCQAPLEISIAKQKRKQFMDAQFIKNQDQKIAKIITLIEESEESLIKRIQNKVVKRIRFLSDPSHLLQQAITDTACHCSIVPVYSNGRIELLHCLREVSLSIDCHRYGYIPPLSGTNLETIK